MGGPTRREDLGYGGRQEGGVIRAFKEIATSLSAIDFFIPSFHTRVVVFDGIFLKDSHENSGS